MSVDPTTAESPRRPATKRLFSTTGQAKRFAEAALAPITGILLALVLIQLSGFQAWPTLIDGLRYATGSTESLAQTLAWGLPLYLATVGITVAFRAGMFTLGAEGQIYIGALVAAVVGAQTGLFTAGIHKAVVLAAAAAAGAAISAGLAWLKSKWGVDEVLSSLLSNYIIVLFCLFVASGPFNDPAADAPGATPAILGSAQFGTLVDRTQMTTALFVVIALCLVTWWTVEKSAVGYRWRMVGQAPGFARSVGMNVGRARLYSMVISGALCGVAGAVLVTSSQGRFTAEIAIGMGWIAIMLALIARNRPALAVLWVTVYAVMRSASRRVEQVAEVPAELALVLVCAILITAAASPAVIEGVWRRLTVLRSSKGGSRGMA